jgi:hypothetical protein
MSKTLRRGVVTLAAITAAAGAAVAPAAAATGTHTKGGVTLRLTQLAGSERVSVTGSAAAGRYVVANLYGKRGVLLRTVKGFAGSTGRFADGLPLAGLKHGKYAMTVWVLKGPNSTKPRAAHNVERVFFESVSLAADVPGPTTASGSGGPSTAGAPGPATTSSPGTGSGAVQPVVVTQLVTNSLSPSGSGKPRVVRVVLTSGSAAVTLACPKGPQSCAGTLAIVRVVTTKSHGRTHSRRYVLASGRYLLGAGKTGVLHLKLTAAGKRFAKPGARPFGAALTLRDKQGHLLATPHVTLRPPAKAHH